MERRGEGWVKGREQGGYQHVPTCKSHELWHGKGGGAHTCMLSRRGIHTWRMRRRVCTIPEVADCHQRANETSDQMVCSLKYVWMIEKLGGSILLGRGIKCMEGRGGGGGR